jgi:hypothetical protein
MSDLDVARKHEIESKYERDTPEIHEAADLPTTTPDC